MSNFPAYGKGFIYIFHPSIITAKKWYNESGIPINVLYILQRVAFIEWLVEDALTNKFQFSATANSGYTFIEFEFASYPVSTKRQIDKIVR